MGWRDAKPLKAGTDWRTAQPLPGDHVVATPSIADLRMKDDAWQPAPGGTTIGPHPELPPEENQSFFNPFPSEKVRAKRRQEILALHPEEKLDEAAAPFRSLAEGASLGMAPLIESSLGPKDDLSDSETEGKYKKAVKDYPAANVAGVVASPIPGPGKLKGLAKYGALAGIGGLSSGVAGYNASEAPEVTGKLEDAAVAGGVGAVAFPLLHATFSGGGKAINALRGSADEIVAKDVAKTAEEVIGSAQGKQRQATAEGYRNVENLGSYVEGKPWLRGVSPDTADLAVRTLDTPGSRELTNKVALNQIRANPDKLKQLNKLTQELVEAPSLAAEKSAAKWGENALQTRVWPQVRNYGGRALGAAAGGALGNEMGDTPGAVAGGIIGGAVGGRPYTAIARMLTKDPQVQVMLRRSLADLLEIPSAAIRGFGKTGALMAAKKTPEARAQLLEEMASTPEGLESLKEDLLPKEERPKFGYFNPDAGTN